MSDQKIWGGAGEPLDEGPLDGEPLEEIAIVGMAGRFPGAADLETYWRNLCEGTESISRFSDAELLAAGVEPAHLRDPRYVRARGVIDGVESFDAPFFGFSPHEAAVTDPQHRVLLECAWEALEQAGIDPGTFPGRIGLYAGSILSTYLLLHLLPRVREDASWPLVLANDKDTLCTRVSYKLNLRGPSVSVQTACSTALVAAHLARQSLLDYECDVALAGAVSIRSPQTLGYLYQEDGILSPDGHCRAFDAAARGTVFSSGAGLVVLKRLADAVAAGDTVRAVVKASAINNDGSLKVGFTAPGLAGQAEVVARALALSGVDPATVSYVEAHGTGTRVGDPMEVAALTRAFRAAGATGRGFCALGSVKGNIGHLDCAAGIAGLIKTVLALEHRQLPPTLHFEQPNPQIDFDSSPFFVNDRLRSWQQAAPRRAGVSSLGIGGTNAHVILEQAPATPTVAAEGQAQGCQLLVLSAKTRSALESSRRRLADHLRHRPEQNLADVAHTLQVGRQALPYRRAVVCRERADALTALEAPRGMAGAAPIEAAPSLAFLFPGQGSQRLGMGGELYRAEPRFRNEIDRSAEILRPHLGEDLRHVLYPTESQRQEAARRLDRTEITQPALFVVETALARLWMSWGLQPEAMLGHSVGELVAAHLAGVLSLEDALALVAVRGRLIGELAGGAMLAVPLRESKVTPLMDAQLSLAAVNGASQCVVSGAPEAIQELRSRLAEQGIRSKRLAGSHAFHSRHMDPVVEAFQARVARVSLKPPAIPFLSNVTGGWITDKEATDPAYWARHLRRTVRFADNLDHLLAGSGRLVLEVGPGRTLTRLVERHARRGGPRRDGRQTTAVTTLPANATESEVEALLAAVGGLWAAGAPVDWTAIRGEEPRRRVALPTYPFERQRHWFEPVRHDSRAGAGRGVEGLALGETPKPADWFHLPSWRRTLPPSGEHLSGAPSGDDASCWLLFLDDDGLGEDLAEGLAASGHPVIRVMAREGDLESQGSGVSGRGGATFFLDPGQPSQYDSLLARLRQAGHRPAGVLHLWTLKSSAVELTEARRLGLDSLSALTRALEQSAPEEAVTVTAISRGLRRVTGNEALYPARATLLGWLPTAGRADGPCRRQCLDIDLPAAGTAPRRRLVERILAEARCADSAAEVAYRGDERWVPVLEAAPLEAPRRSGSWLRPQGCYLLTGGLGSPTLALARQLASQGPARLVLLTPPGRPTDSRGGGHALERLAAEVLAPAADPTDRASMERVLEQVEATWGELHGVFLLPGPGGPSAWMRSALVLDDLLGDDRPRDFFVFFAWHEPPPEAPDGPELRAASALVDTLAARRAPRAFATTVAIDRGADVRSEELFDLVDRILSRPMSSRVAVLPPRRESVAEPAADAEPLADPLPGDDPLVAGIADIWRQVLGVRQIRSADRFFDLGGDSLIALQVLSRLREAFSVELSARVLFERTTVLELRDAVASALAARSATLSRGQDAARPEIGRRTETAPAPLSSSQQRLWFLDQLEPGNAAYNLRVRVRLTGELDRQALAVAFRGIVRRHQSLRTTFAAGPSGPVQRALSSADVALPRIDLAGLDAVRRQSEVAARARDDSRRGFDLSSGPLLRVYLLELGGDDHLLLVSLHHIVSDGWSMGVLLSQLATLYEGYARGHVVTLPPLPVQYADYAQWQQRWLSEGGADEALAFWKRALADAPGRLELPTDHPRPPRASFRGSSCPVALPADSAEALAELARRQGATLFMVLLSLFDTLLLRYTGQQDLVVGSPVAGRGRQDLEELIGLFVNTLVLRADLAADPSFEQLLVRTRRRVLEAVDHQDVPYGRLVEELRPDRDLSGNPLFQVMFAFQNTPLPEITLDNLTLRQEELPSQTAMFDLTLSLRQRDGSVAGALEYSTDLFEAATAERMVAHLACLARGAAEDPRRRLSELPLLTAAEHRQLMGWNDAVAPFRLDVCLDAMVARWVAEIPDSPAVVCDDRAGGDRAGGDRVLSFGALGRRADRLARRLIDLGVGPDMPVALWAGRSPEMVVGVLGILKAGGAYLPLDESYPRERLALIIDDARVSVVVTDAPEGEELPVGGAQVLHIGAGASEEPAAEAPDAETGPVTGGGHPESLAYVIYTSGSTGRPKGVACTHVGVVNIVADMERRKALAPGEGCLLWTSIGFDVSVYELFSSLCHGGVLHVPSDPRRARAETLFPWMERRRVRSGYLSPFLIEELAQRMREGGDERRQMSRLLVGVEPIRERILASIVAAVPGLRIVNGYGPTEATVCATFYDVGPGPVAERRTPLGLPVANDRVHLLDGGLREVPIGVTGEVWISGVGLARGYSGRPALTADRFVPDPIGGPGAGPGSRCYRTGDLARRLVSGHLEFLGRRDQQVKLRGFRIELREIEATLGLHPDVREAAVVLREAPGGDKRLVAYPVPARQGIGPSAWREFLAERLPDAMIPSIFVPLTALPLTPSGKVDRRALPEPDWSAALAAGERVLPRNPTEALLADIWSELLGHPTQMGVTHDFFDLGGHSLLATQVASRVREVFQVELPVRRLFEASTVAQLARVVEALRNEPGHGQGRAVPPIAPLARGGELPLSFAQQRLWFIDQLEPGSPAYNVPWMGWLGGELDAAVLRRALQEIVRRHEVLRTTFGTAAAGPVQVVQPDPRIELPVVSLAGLPEGVGRREARRLAVVDALTPFDLAQGPLIRVTLVRLAERQHAMLVNLHHIVTDGWSMGVLVREVAALYGAFAVGQASPLAELPIQYADFAAWQRHWLDGAVLDEQLRYWRARLAAAPPQLELITDRPRPARPSLRGRGLPITLSSELSRDLAALSRRQGVTPFMTLLAAFSFVLGRWAGQDDVVVGIPIANRNRHEIENLIGFFVNTLALRADLRGEPTFRDLLERMREVTLGAYAHQDLPFERLVDELQLERDTSRSPLVQVMFVFHNLPVQELALPGLVLRAAQQEIRTSRFDLTLTLTESEDAWAGALEYRTDLFDRSTVHRLGRHLRVVLEGLLTGLDRPVRELPVGTEGELQAILEWNDTAWPYEPHRSLGQRFLEQARLGPDRVAVRLADAVLSYRELDRRANQLACHLRGLGVGADEVVGVFTGRCFEMVVGLLAVLKAGGAFLPLDPDYPRERLAFMLEDSGAAVVLTHEGVAERLPEVCVRRLLLDTLAPELRRLPTEDPGIVPDPDHIAYVIYTSGSTGQPKGVLVRHRGLARLASANVLGTRPQDVMLQFSSFSFDAATFEIAHAFAAGAAVHLISGSPQPGEPLLHVLRERGITQAVLSPAALAALPAAAPGELSRLTTLMVAGAACPSELAARWHAGRLLLNGYGPTESTIIASCGRFDPVTGHFPIGRVFPNTRIHLVDRKLRPVGMAGAGELLIESPGLARGYLHRRGLTAERFVPNPFLEDGTGRELGGRVYRSGDLARYLADGNLEFLGRLDHQVKLRGFRIELGEIEAVLRSHPGVVEAVAEVRDVRAGSESRHLLVAYVVPEASAPASRDLREFLRRQLPEFMVPSLFVSLEALPLNPNGKVDRRALPAPDRDEGGTVAPRTPIEARLAAIWKEVLEVSSVGVDDNFFDLGGDSILGIQVITRAQQAGLGLTARELFQHQTIAELAAVARTTAPGSQSEDDDSDIVLTPIQRWFFDLDLADPHHFNQALLLDLKQAVDPVRLQTALELLVRRHTALRCRFVRGPEWRQVVTETRIPVPCVDLSALPQSSRRGALEKAAARLQASLDLTRGPLMQVVLWTLGEGARRLFWVLHHLVVDGVSWRVLLSDLELALGALARGERPTLPAVPTSLRQWAQRLAERPGAIAGELDYWLAIERAAVPSLPVDRPRGDNSVASARSLVTALATAETEALLQDVPPVYHTRIEDALLTALARAVADATGERRLLVDLERHGREEIFAGLDASRTVGWLTALYPMLLDLGAKEQDPGEYLKSIKEQLRSVPGQGLGYGILRYLGAPETAEALAKMPAPQVVFNYLGQLDRGLPASSLLAPAPESGGPARSSRQRRAHLLEVNGGITGGRLRLTWTYSEGLHDECTIRSLTEKFMSTLRQLIDHCRAADRSTFTPSDFPEARISAQDLDSLMGQISKKSFGMKGLGNTTSGKKKAQAR